MTRSIRPSVRRPQKTGSREEVVRVLVSIQWVLAHSLSGKLQSVGCLGLTFSRESLRKASRSSRRAREGGEFVDEQSNEFWVRAEGNEHRTTDVPITTELELMLELNDGRRGTPTALVQQSLPVFALNPNMLPLEAPHSLVPPPEWRMPNGKVVRRATTVAMKERMRVPGIRRSLLLGGLI
ncbi:hypothetical protein M9H77_30677 [Catharanthus roseus]|uniref:Uncharacterized protein n=1 Tax=Catharanthus roseus TaxID=4058 RepID=A0ACB9ZYZ4_CATRO|nr:hypothetical protein M9H77_30677 [Catharanthus roseus]